MRIENITEREIERWRAGLSGSRKGRETLSNKTKNHQLVLMHAIFGRAVKLYGLPRNPLANVDRYRVQRSGDIEVFSPEEVWSLVRAAASHRQHHHCAKASMAICFSPSTAICSPQRRP
jgi:hypothetical protein